MIILFKIIRFYIKKISETNTAHVQKRGYSTDAGFGSRSFCLNFATGRSMEMTAKLRGKVTAASPVQKNVCGKLFVHKLWKREYCR